MSRIGNRKLSSEIVVQGEKVSLHEKVHRLVMGKLSVNDSFKLLSELVEGKSRIDNIEYSNAVLQKSENEFMLAGKKAEVENLLTNISLARYPSEMRKLVSIIQSEKPTNVTKSLRAKSSKIYPIYMEYIGNKGIDSADESKRSDLGFVDQMVLQMNLQLFIEEYENNADDIVYQFQPGTQDDTEILTQEFRKAKSEYETMEKKFATELPARVASKFEIALKSLCEYDSTEIQSYPDKETKEAIDLFLKSASSALPPQDIVNLHNSGQPSIESMILRSLDHYPEAYAKLTSYQVQKVVTDSKNIISKQLTQLISEIEMLNNLTNAGLRPIYVCGLFSKHICGNARTIAMYWLTKSSTLITSDLEHLFKLQGIRDIKIGLPINFAKSKIDDNDRYIEDEVEDIY